MANDCKMITLQFARQYGGKGEGWASQVIIPLSIVAEANKSSLGSGQSGARPWHTYAQANGSQGHTRIMVTEEGRGRGEGSTPTATWLDTAEGSRRGRGVAEWTVDATQNVSDIICQNKLFDVVASQRKCVHPPPPSLSVLDDSLPGVSSSAPVLSITLSLLPRSLPSVSLFCCVCLQTTTNCCLMHDRLMPPGPCHMPLATCLTCLNCLTPAQRHVYHYYRDSRPALCQNPSLLVRGLVSSVCT